MSNRRTMSVEAFSHQSLRRSASRACSLAIAVLTSPRRFEPRLALASWRYKAPQAPLAFGVGGDVQHLAGGRAPRTRRRPGRADGLAVGRPGRGSAANATCSGAGRGSSDDLRRRNGAGPAEPDPARLRDGPRPCRFRRRTYHGLTATIRNPSSRPALRHAACGASRRRSAPSPARSPAAPAAGHLRALPEPRVLGTGRGELPALLQVAGRGPAARTPVRLLLGREVPQVPGVRAVSRQHGLLFGSGGQSIAGHANIISEMRRRRFLSGLNARVFEIAVSLGARVIAAAGSPSGWSSAPRLAPMRSSTTSGKT